MVDRPGADLTGLLVGAEGTLGIVTKIIVRLMRLPEAVITRGALFKTVDDAANTVSDIIGAGLLPAALELLNKAIMQAVDQAVHIGYPAEAGAALIIRLDGLPGGHATQPGDGRGFLSGARCPVDRDRREYRGCRTPVVEPAYAFGAMARLGSHCYIVDGCVPRTQLPEALRRVMAIGERYGLRIANLAHAGDGNLHPSIPFNSLVPGKQPLSCRLGATSSQCASS